MKKKKLTVNTLARGNLKMRRKQYTLLIIGIIFAMVFSSGILFFISCMRTSSQERIYRMVGRQDSLFMNMQESDFQSEEAKGLFKQVSFAHVIAYAYRDGYEENDGTAVGWLDADAKELSNQTLTEGRMPEAEGEIAAEKDALVRLGYDQIAVGDTLTLLTKAANGSGYQEEPTETVYTLVGILENKRQAMEWVGYGYEYIDLYVPAFFVADDTKPAAGGKELLDAYVLDIDKSTEEWSERFNTFMDKSETDYGQYVSDFNFILYSGIAYAAGDNVRSSLIISIFLTAVLLIVSGLVIINSFNTNLRERRTQIGLLRAVGTTRRQIVNIFGREAFMIALICIPVSLLLSYLIVRGITLLLGDGFVFKPPLWVLPVSAVVGFVFVMLAALIPLIRGARISPMQAIRNVDMSYKMKKRKIRSQSSFRVPALLASRNLTFYRGKQVIVSIMLILTVLLSCFGLSETQNMSRTFTSYINDYLLSFSMGTGYSFCNVGADDIGYSEDVRHKILLSPYVASTTGLKTAEINFLPRPMDDYSRLLTYMSPNVYNWLDSGFTEENYREVYEQNYSYIYQDAQRVFQYDRTILDSEITAVDTSLLKLLEPHVVEGKINIDKLNTGEEIILIAPETLSLYLSTGKYSGGESFTSLLVDVKQYDDIHYLETYKNPYHAGDTIDLSSVYVDALSGDEQFFPSEYVRKDHTVTVGAVLNEIPDEFIRALDYRYFSIGPLGFMTTFSGMTTLVGDVSYDVLTATLKQACTQEVDEYMMNYLDGICSGAPYHNISSNYSYGIQQRQSRNMFFIIIVSVIILFFSAAASIINNSLTAGIRENKREIGTLRAVGTGMRELSQMYIRQLLSMFLWGYGIGLGAYALLHGVLKLVDQFYEIGYDLPFSILPTALFGLVLFAICACNLLIKLRQLTKFSIVENIREL